MSETQNGDRRVSGPRLIALVGPFQSGKTTLLESILGRSGALSRQGSVRDGSSIGDSSAEARAAQQPLEVGVGKDIAVGFRELHLHLDVDTDADPEAHKRLIELTERYCVVYQTLKQPPPIVSSSG